MDFITALLLIVLGILAAAPIIVARAPNSRQAIENLRPAQGVLGLIVCLWGLWTVIRLLMHLDWLRLAPLTWMIFFATGVVELLLGFLMGYAVINRFVLSGSAGASAKGAEMERKLSGIQVPLGVAGIVLGVIALVLAIRYGG
jgi:hypothetical protein